MLELSGGYNAEGGPRYWVNGVPGNANVEGYEYLLSSQLAGGFKVHHWKISDNQHIFSELTLTIREMLSACKPTRTG